jgi:ABC-type amino acid transport system permease subunit
VDPNPLVPSAYDVVWGAVMLVQVVLAIIALVSLARSRGSLTGAQTLVWVLLILLMPLLGAIAWLVAGRPRTAVPAAR